MRVLRYCIFSILAAYSIENFMLLVVSILTAHKHFLSLQVIQWFNLTDVSLILWGFRTPGIPDCRNVYFHKDGQSTIFIAFTPYVHPMATTVTVTSSLWFSPDNLAKTALSSTGTNRARVTEFRLRLRAQAAACAVPFLVLDISTKLLTSMMPFIPLHRI